MATVAWNKHSGWWLWVFIGFFLIQITGLTCIQDFASWTQSTVQATFSGETSHSLGDPGFPDHDCPCHYSSILQQVSLLTSQEEVTTGEMPPVPFLPESLPGSIFRPPMPS